MTKHHAPPRPGSQTMRLERLIDASPETVYGAFLDKAVLAKWISPFPGVDAQVQELDARVGGRVRFVMVDDKGNAFPPEELTFEELTPFSRIVQYQSNAGRNDIFADHPLRMTVTLEPVGARTRLVLTQEGLPASFPLDMAKGGFSACLDKLEKAVARAPAPKLRLERTFDAPQDALWSAWTDPQQYAKWFNPAPGIDLVMHEFDVRPGGKIRFDMPQPDGNKHPQQGVFHEVTPKSRIVSGEPDRSFLLEVDLIPQGPHRTRCVVNVTGVPAEYHQMATQGWNAGFDKLAALLKARA